MMYNKNLAVAIKTKGKVLREFKDKVYLPFGSEYSILIKNLNTVKALVNVYIDGTNVTSNGLVLYPGDEIDFERSIANGNLDVGNKFKFIERTGDIESHRGVKLEDGIVRIEYQFEKVYQPNYGGIYKGISSGMWSGSASINSVTRSTLNTSASSFVENEAGITVPGSKSEQKFINVCSFLTESEKHCIVLNLLGETNNKLVVESVTVKHKPKCPTCGTHNRAHAKFCSKCGTALEIFA